MDDSILDRREMLELISRAAAMPGAAIFLSAWLRGSPEHTQHAGSSAPPQPDLLRAYQPKFFSREDFEALEAFTQILIPSDEDPGAREAQCARFIDFVLQASGEVPQTQANWRRAMDEIRTAGFHTSDARRRQELVADMSRPEIEHDVQHPAFFAYRLIKQQTAFAFYTSRVGMIDVLDYKGNSYNATFPGCNHPQHQSV